MTGNDLFAQILRSIGVLASGEPIPASEAQDVRLIINQMLDAWSADRLTIFTLNRSVFNLVATKQTYTMGTGGDFNTPRPPKIYRWSIISNQNPTLPLELDQGEPLTDREWQDIPVKNITSTLARKMYDDGSFPLRNLSFYPIPSDSTAQVAIYVWAALQQFANLTTDYTFPPGYMEAIKYQGAVRVAAEWPGAVVSAAMTTLAVQALGRVKSMNLPQITLECDDMNGKSADNYNWMADDYR